MNAYLARLFHESSPEEINALRERYFHQYGVTMLGLVKHHNVDADEFLHEVHHFPTLSEMLVREAGLCRLLKNLPGKKILFTNAPDAYARRVLRHLGIYRHFIDYISVERMKVHRDYAPKPSKKYLKKLCARMRLKPNQCVLVEDSLVNLRAAQQCGMKTAWITGHTPTVLQKRARKKYPHWLHVKVKSVMQLSNQVHRL